MTIDLGTKSGKLSCSIIVGAGVFFWGGGGGGGGLSTVCETALVYFCYVAVVLYMKVLFGCWVAGNTHDGRSGETDR